MQRRLAEKRQVKGAIAQLGERLPCTQEVGGSIPPGSTISPSSNEAFDSCAKAHFAKTFVRSEQNGDSKSNSKFQGLELKHLRMFQFWL